jgi:hypothetical protein
VRPGPRASRSVRSRPSQEGVRPDCRTDTDEAVSEVRESKQHPTIARLESSVTRWVKHKV